MSDNNKKPINWRPFLGPLFVVGILLTLVFPILVDIDWNNQSGSNYVSIVVGYFTFIGVFYAVFQSVDNSDQINKLSDIVEELKISNQKQDEKIGMLSGIVVELEKQSKTLTRDFSMIKTERLHSNLPEIHIKHDHELQKGTLNYFRMWLYSKGKGPIVYLKIEEMSERNEVKIVENQKSALLVTNYHLAMFPCIDGRHSFDEYYFDLKITYQNIFGTCYQICLKGYWPDCDKAQYFCNPDEMNEV